MIFLKVENSTDPYNAQEFVDLGLPSGNKWAKQNIGADKETDLGLYFSWADTVGYKDTSIKKFKWDDCKYYYNGTITKYNSGDDKTILEESDDAGVENWGGYWKMPTANDFLELQQNCKSEWISNYNNSGVNGRLFTSLINNNTLFIPASGFLGNGLTYNVNEYCFMWTSTLSTALAAKCLNFNYGWVDIKEFHRYFGFTIRLINNYE